MRDRLDHWEPGFWVGNNKRKCGFALEMKVRNIKKQITMGNTYSNQR